MSRFSKIKKYTFHQLKFIAKTTLTSQVSLSSLSTNKVTLYSNIIRFLMKRGDSVGIVYV